MKTNEFALLQTLSHLFQLIQFVKCQKICLQLNSERLYQSSGKEKESYCLEFTSLGTFTLQSYGDCKEMYKKRLAHAKLLFSQSKPIAFFPSSLLLPSLLLKLPNIMVKLLNRDHIDKVDQLDHRKTTIHSKKVGQGPIRRSKEKQ